LPRAREPVLAVASNEPHDSRSLFSSYGSYVTLFAPGDNIWTTQPDLNNPYGAWPRTSFASPVVAGVAALVLSLNPSLSNTQIVEVLKQTADGLGPAAGDLAFTSGRVNALRAVSAVSPVPVAQVPVSPPVSITNFPPESVLPGVTIISAPPNGARLMSPAISLSGTARDNVGVDHVEVRVN